MVFALNTVIGILPMAVTFWILFIKMVMRKIIEPLRFFIIEL